MGLPLQRLLLLLKKLILGSLAFVSSGEQSFESPGYTLAFLESCLPVNYSPPGESLIIWKPSGIWRIINIPASVSHAHSISCIEPCGLITWWKNYIVR